MDPSTSDARALQDEFTALVRRFGLSGLAATVVTPRLGATTLVAGTRRASPHRAIDAHTPFSIASSGKHAVGMAVLALESDGRLTTDDRLARWLPEVSADWGARTLMQLLRHTGGLPEYLASDPDVPPPRDRAGFVARYGGLPPLFEPDTAWSYSNTNYILLGLVVAAAAGRPFVDYFRDRLLAPARCDGVALGGPGIPDVAPDLAPDLAPGVARSLDVWAAIEAETRSRDVVGDGDLVLSPHGAAAWERALAGEAGLAPASAAKAMSPGTFLTGRPVPYGAGWFTDRIAGHPCCWHAGGFDGWTAFVQRAPHAGAAVWLMCDADVANTRAQRYIAQRILESASPGATALALAPLVDDEPSLTAMTRRAMLRPDGAAPDPDLLAPELRVVAATAGRRGVPNLWTGEEPQSFALVEQAIEDGARFRRYRLAYPDRVEHLRAGHAPDGRLFWAYAA